MSNKNHKDTTGSQTTAAGTTTALQEGSGTGQQENQKDEQQQQLDLERDQQKQLDQEAGNQQGETHVGPGHDQTEATEEVAEERTTSGPRPGAVESDRDRERNGKI